MGGEEAFDGGVTAEEFFEIRGGDGIDNDVGGGACGASVGTVAGVAIEAEDVAFAEDIEELGALRAVDDKFDAPLLDDPDKRSFG